MMGVGQCDPVVWWHWILYNKLNVGVYVWKRPPLWWVFLKIFYGDVWGWKWHFWIGPAIASRQKRIIICKFKVWVYNNVWDCHVSTTPLLQNKFECILITRCQPLMQSSPLDVPKRKKRGFLFEILVICKFHQWQLQESSPLKNWGYNNSLYTVFYLIKKKLSR